ncbi:hypothetical protein QPK13_15160 [Photorhabdus tasmaniensis]
MSPGNQKRSEHDGYDGLPKEEADYLLAVKGNQKKLLAVLTSHFSMERLANRKGDDFNTEEKNHATAYQMS